MTEKEAFIAKAIKALSTPIKGTPKLLMKNRSPQELQALEDGVRAFQNDKVHGGAYRAMKKIKLDKFFQAMEPIKGSSTATPAMRATSGDRAIWDIAHQPIRKLVSLSPISFPGLSAGEAYQGLRGAAQKAFNVPGPKSYPMPPEHMIPGIEKYLPKATHVPDIPRQPQLSVVPPLDPALTARKKVGAAYRAGADEALWKFAGVPKESEPSVEEVAAVLPETVAEPEIVLPPAPESPTVSPEVAVALEEARQQSALDHLNALATRSTQRHVGPFSILHHFLRR